MHISYIYERAFGRIDLLESFAFYLEVSSCAQVAVRSSVREGEMAAIGNVGLPRQERYAEYHGPSAGKRVAAAPSACLDVARRTPLPAALRQRSQIVG